MHLIELYMLGGHAGHRLSVPAAALAIALLYSPAAPNASTGKELAQSLVAMVFGRETPEAARAGLGAAVVVGKDKASLYLVTANHVVRRAFGETVYDAAVEFRQRRGQRIPVLVLDLLDRRWDLTVLRLDNPESYGLSGSTFAFDRRGVIEELDTHSQVSIVGFKNSDPWSTSPKAETVSAVRTGEIRFNSQFVGRGHSGGGLFDEAWRLVGMMQADEPPDAIAITLDLVLERLRDWGIPVNLTGERARLPSDRISRGREVVPRSGPGQDELQAWESAANSADPKLLQDYLDRFPDGYFADIAHIQIMRHTSPGASRPENDEQIEDFGVFKYDDPGAALKPSRH